MYSLTVSPALNCVKAWSLGCGAWRRLAVADGDAVHEPSARLVHDHVTLEQVVRQVRGAAPVRGLVENAALDTVT